MLGQTGEIARRGRVVGPEIERTDYAALETILLDDIRANRRPSYLASTMYRVRHLRKAFGKMLAMTITHDMLTRFKARRLEHARPATVRLELVLMGRMFRLAQMAGLVEHVPPIPRVNVDNAKAGFCSPAEIERVIGHLPEHLRHIVRLLYGTGMRSHEALSLRWAQVDLRANLIELRAADTKTSRARTIPLGRTLAELLHEQRRQVAVLEHGLGRIIPHVFTDPAGEPIGSFKRSWLSAVKLAGLPALRPHDLRRSAARNFIRAGVSEGVTMALLGHRTRSMFDRYNITAAADLLEGVGKLDLFLSGASTDTQTDTLRGSR